MRPVLLEVQGFGAFRDPVSIDFTDVEFFALVGDTGAGKSTVLDAICFALYGNVPRYDDQRLVGAAMSLGANEAKVRLSFEVGGERYVVARVVRRGTQNRVSTKEARLERVRDGLILAGRESELRAEVERVVGLGFDDFTRCVVLPQGSFARFLHDKPADRQALLVRLLELGVYGRLVNRANARAAEHQRDLDRLTGQMSELPVVGADDLDELDRRASRLQQLVEVIDGAEPRLTELDAEAARLDHEASADTAALDALSAISAPAWLAEHAAACVRADDDLRHSEDAATLAGREAEHWEAEVEAQPDPSRLEQLLATHTRIARGVAVVDTRAREVAESEARRAGATAELDAAVERLDRARRRYQDVEAAHRAHALAVTLRPGEACPVCEQVVATLPLPVRPAALETASAQVDRAEDDHRHAVVAADAAVRAEIQAAAEWKAADGRLRELQADVADAPDPREIEATLAAARHTRSRLADARTALRAAGERVRECRAEIDRLAAARRDVTDAFHRQRDTVVALGPPSPVADLAEAWAALEVWASSVRPSVAESLETRRNAAHAARATHRSLLSELRDAVVGLGLDLPSAPAASGFRSVVVRAAAATDQRRDALVRSVARRVELADAARHAEEARSVAHELARQLKTDRFQRWLVEETFQALAVSASNTLLRLSSGQFSLRVTAATSEFSVVDHLAADEERSVRTLSGGETFQASLALALALSDHVMDLAGARGQHKLESIFLDEGFGTLDPSTLDTVASTIETLGTDGRMIGIVTHVAELADRVPVRFRVAKGARTSIITREV